MSGSSGGLGSRGLPAAWLWFGLIIVAMAAARFAVMFGTGPIHDEAYYWAWSQRLDFGYYDQPFLTGWLLAPFVAVLGDGAWVLRLVASGLTGLTTLFLGLSVLRLRETLGSSAAPDGQDHDRLNEALPGLALLCLTSPLLWGVGLLYVHDTILLCGLSAGLWLGLTALAKPPGSWSRGWWLGAGAALGLAFSAKVSGALWIFALGLGVAVHPAGWRHLRHLGPWLGALLVAMAAGLFVGWNALNDWVTFRHVGGEHLGADLTDLSAAWAERAGRVGVALAATVLLAGPAAAALTLAGMGRALRNRSSVGVFALLAFAFLPLLGFVALAWVREIYLNWLLPSAMGVTVLGAVFWPPRVKGWHVISSAPAALLSLAVLIPLALREPRFMLANARDILGWEASIALLVDYRDEAFPDAVIAGNYYHLAAQLAFHQRQVLPSVGADPRPHQFALFEDRTGALDGPALVLTPSLEAGRAALEDSHCGVTPLVPWPVNHGRGGTIDTPYLFITAGPRSNQSPCEDEGPRQSESLNAE